MWHTAAGDRTLTGAEAKLLRESLRHVVDMIERDADIDESWPFDIPVFDSLAWQQKLALLAQVAAALFREDVPMPELTAVSEAAVAVLFENVAQCIQIEIDLADDLEPCDDGIDPTFCASSSWQRSKTPTPKNSDLCQRQLSRTHLRIRSAKCLRLPAKFSTSGNGCSKHLKTTCCGTPTTRWTICSWMSTRRRAAAADRSLASTTTTTPGVIVYRNLGFRRR